MSDINDYMLPSNLRELGYYWVRHNGAIRIAEWTGSEWAFTNAEIARRGPVALCRIEQPNP